MLRAKNAVLLAGAVAAALLVGLAGQADAAIVTLIQNSSPGDSWDNGPDWSDGLPAQAGNDYHVGDSTGKNLRTPSNVSNPLFPGDSLTLHSTSTLALKNSGTCTIPDLHLDGGSIGHWVGNRTIGVGGTITVDSASSMSAGSDGRVINLAGTLVGSGGLSFSGGGTLRITGTNNAGYSGDWSLGSGTTKAEGAGSLGSGNVAVQAGGTLDADYDIESVRSLTLDGVLVLDQMHTFDNAVIGGTPLAPGSYSYADLNTAYDPYIADGGSGTLNVFHVYELNASQPLTSPPTTWADGSYWTYLADGTTGVAPSQSYDVALVPGRTLRSPTSGSHTYQPHLLLQSGGSLGIKSTGTLTFSDLRFQGGGMSMSSSGTGHVAGSLTVETSGEFYMGSGRTIEVSGQLSGAGTLSVDGGGTCRVTSGASPFTGNWRVDDGTLEAAAPGALGSGGVTVDSGEALNLNGNAQSIRYLAGGGQVALGAGTGDVLTLTDGAGQTFSGALAGSGNVVKSGSATQYFTGTVDLDGDLVIDGGRVEFEDFNSAITSPLVSGSVIVNDGGIFRIDHRGTTHLQTALANGLIASDLVIHDGGYFDAEYRSSLGGPYEVNQRITITGDAANSPNRSQLQHDIQGSSVGPREVHYNNLWLADGAALGIYEDDGVGRAGITLAGNAALTRDGGNSRDFDLAHVSSPGGAHTLTIGQDERFSTILFGPTDADTTLDLANAAVTVDVPAGGSIGGSAIVRAGSTLTFDGGASTVGGNLSVLGTVDFANGGSVAVDGILSGTGSVEGPATIHAGGTLGPGNGGTGTLSLGDLVFDPASIFQVEIAAIDDFDFADVAGAAELAGTVEVILDGYTPSMGDEFLILHAGTLEGAFDGIDDAAAALAPPGYWDIRYDYAAGDVYLQMLPEPATMCLLALGAGPLALRRRKHRSH